KRLARKIQRPVNSVRLRRLRLGIRAFNPSRHFWTPEDDQLLGIRPDDQVALFIRATVKAVRRRRHERKIPRCAQQPRQRGERKAGGKFGVYTAEEDKLLGTMPDERLAQHFGRTRLAVQARRIQLKIPKFDPQLHRWTPEEDALLGTVTDGKLAARLGLTTGAVAHRRRRLGICVRFAHRRPWTPAEDA